MIEITDSIDWKKWDEFVYNHSNGTIFQTSYMASIYNSTKNYEPISLAGVDSKNGNILALVQSVTIREMRGLLGSFSARSVIHGEPLLVDGKEGLETAAKLMQHYEQVVQKEALYTQIRNMGDTRRIKELLESREYTYDDHLNYLIDLDRDSEEIWGDISKSRRKGINRAEKMGITVRKIENEDELNDCYNLIEETYNSIKLPIADITLFKSAYDLLKPPEIADFYIAHKNDEAVGTRIVLKYKGTVHDWYAGSKREVEYVDEALVWQILKDNAGKERVFDFGGAGHPDKPYGVREFKRRFGGKEVNFGRYEKTHSRNKMKIAKSGLKLYQKCKFRE